MTSFRHLSNGLVGSGLSRTMIARVVISARHLVTVVSETATRIQVDLSHTWEAAAGQAVAGAVPVRVRYGLIERVSTGPSVAVLASVRRSRARAPRSRSFESDLPPSLQPLPDYDWS